MFFYALGVVYAIIKEHSRVSAMLTKHAVHHSIECGRHICESKQASQETFGIYPTKVGRSLKLIKEILDP